MSGKTKKAGNSKEDPQNKGKDFYATVLDEAEQFDFDLASGMEGIDNEIALLRIEIKKAVAGGDSGNLRLLVEATNALQRLIWTRYRITKEQRKGLKEAMANVLKDIALPLGIGIGATIEKRIG
jgi:hypothetical protein